MRKRSATAGHHESLTCDQADEVCRLAKHLAAVSREVLAMASTWEVAVYAGEVFVAALTEAARREGHAVPRYQLNSNPPVSRRGDL